MNLWTQAAARQNEVLDRVYGERTNILRPAQGSAYVATDAPPQVLHAGLIGVIDQGTDAVGLDGDAGGRRDFRGQLRAGEIVISFTRSRFLSQADWPKAGCLIQAIDREGAPMFEAAENGQLDEGGRVNVPVVRRASP
jgi:hypothetical protein